MNSGGLEARKNRILQVVIIVRIVLASALLLSARAIMFQFGPWAKLVGIAELILGVIIAAGLVLLGTFSAISKSIFAIPFVHRPRKLMLLDGQTTDPSLIAKNSEVQHRTATGQKVSLEKQRQEYEKRIFTAPFVYLQARASRAN